MAIATSLCECGVIDCDLDRGIQPSHKPTLALTHIMKLAIGILYFLMGSAATVTAAPVYGRQETGLATDHSPPPVNIHSSATDLHGITDPPSENSRDPSGKRAF